MRVVAMRVAYDTCRPPATGLNHRVGSPLMHHAGESPLGSLDARPSQPRRAKLSLACQRAHPNGRRDEQLRKQGILGFAKITLL
jgi:hypothetical protein